MEIRQKYASKFIREPLLDIGCGDGKLLDNHIGVGVEFDRLKSKIAREKGHIVYTLDFERAEFEGLPDNPSKRFQTVTLTDVIEHFENPVKVVKRIREKQLAYGGNLVVTTPNVMWWFWKLYYKLGGIPHAWVNPEHKQFYSPKTLIKTLKLAGFKEFEFNSYGKIPFTNIHFKTPIQSLACNIVVDAR